jgi:hypothetical protein
MVNYQAISMPMNKLQQIQRLACSTPSAGNAIVKKFDNANGRSLRERQRRCSGGIVCGCHTNLRHDVTVRGVALLYTCVSQSNPRAAKLLIFHKQKNWHQSCLSNVNTALSDNPVEPEFSGAFSATRFQQGDYHVEFTCAPIFLAGTVWSCCIGASFLLFRAGQSGERGPGYPVSKPGDCRGIRLHRYGRQRAS